MKIFIVTLIVIVGICEMKAQCANDSYAEVPSSWARLDHSGILFYVCPAQNVPTSTCCIPTSDGNGDGSNGGGDIAFTSPSECRQHDSSIPIESKPPQRDGFVTCCNKSDVVVGIKNKCDENVFSC